MMDQTITRRVRHLSAVDEWTDPSSVGTIVEPISRAHFERALRRMARTMVIVAGAVVLALAGAVCLLR